MQIPKKITIFGETVKIKRVESLKRTSSFGEAHYRYNEIFIDNTIPDDLIESTFFHELTHFVLHKMGENEMCDNEKFVCTFSALLHQSLKDCLK